MHDNYCAERESNEDQDGGHHDNEDSSESTSKFSPSQLLFFSLIVLLALATADSIGSDFNIGTWLVADRCKGHLQDLHINPRNTTFADI